MTLLVTSIAPGELDALESCAEEAWGGGAEAIEIRIDRFGGDPAGLATYLKARGEHTWIVTCRSRAEGGYFAGSLQERVSLLIEATRGTTAYIDFEFADWQGSPGIREQVELASATTQGRGHNLILSAHEFSAIEQSAVASPRLFWIKSRA